MKKIIISIDGPAGSGKGKIAKYISNKWKFKHLDSGILYRKLAHILLKEKIDITSKEQVKKIIDENETLTFRNSQILRNEKISKIASKIAVHQFIRDYVNKIQRNFVNYSQNNKCFVIDGRDIGSVVFKNANLKLYIEVSEQIRAKRRYKQLIDTGEKSIYPQILKDIKLRDKKDKQRKNSPLLIPYGGIIINNNGAFKNTISQINSLIRNL